MIIIVVSLTGLPFGKDVLISPQRVAPRFSDLTPEEVADLFVTSQHVARVVEKEFSGTALTLSIQVILLR